MRAIFNDDAEHEAGSGRKTRRISRQPQAAAGRGVHGKFMAKFRGPSKARCRNRALFGSHGYDIHPQKFVRLVGCHQPLQRTACVTDRSDGRVGILLRECHVEGDDAHHLQRAFGCTDGKFVKPGRRLPAMFHRGRKGFDPDTSMFRKWRPLSLIFEGQAPALR